MKKILTSRRQMLKGAWNFSLFAVMNQLFSSYSWAQKIGDHLLIAKSGQPIDLSIRKSTVTFDGIEGKAISINGTIPGPAIYLKEGQEAVIRVTNYLEEITSVHWHGILLPPDMDGVPGVSFPGIKPGETFTYRFPIKQSGTYWYHSHSAGQEQQGMYAPLIIEPLRLDPFSYERDYIIQLSDWSPREPMELLTKLKKDNGYFNYQKRTVGDFFQDAKTMGFSAAMRDRLQWMKMRMEPTDIMDITGSIYKYLLNGQTPNGNWTGLFKKGDRIRLRFIGSAAMTIFDVRIPGLQMTLVQADGQNVQPVLVEEFRISPGETYDFVVEPLENKPYAIFAESIDRSGYAMGTLAHQLGLRAQIPERRQRPLRSMADMGMSMSGMEMEGNSVSTSGGHDMSGMKNQYEKPQKAQEMNSMPGQQMPKMPDHKMNSNKDQSPIPGSKPVPHGPDNHGPGNAAVPQETKNRLQEPGTGLDNNDRRVLVYTDLKTICSFEDQRKPEREIELHLTGNMERYMWSINGKKYSEDSEPIAFRFGERLRLTMVNDTMMEHPMHLHGMWMYLENGTGSYMPRKHTVIVKPAERLSVAITAEAKGDWAFHCHMLFHMEMGMFRVVRVSDEKSKAQST